MSQTQWLNTMEHMIKQPTTNHMDMPMRAKRLIQELRQNGKISPDKPLIYWIVGPADSIAQVQHVLSEADKACVFVIAMGSSIVPGHSPSKAPAIHPELLGQSSALVETNNRLPFGPDSGFSPWPETNVKGDDAVFGNGKSVREYKAFVQDPHWAALLLAPSEPVCDSQPGAGGTSQALKKFKQSSSTGPVALMDMLRAWTSEAAEQCHGDNRFLLKCAPASEANGIAASGYSHLPAQCDIMSIMPWIYADNFGVETMYLDFTTEGVRGCAMQVNRPPDKKCINVATYYKPKGSSATRAEVTYEQGSLVRDRIVSAWMGVIETGGALEVDGW